MIERAIAAEVPFSWVAADSVYSVGAPADFGEQALRRAGKGYVLGVNANHAFNSWAKPYAIAGTAREIAERDLRVDLRTYPGNPQRKAWQEQAKKLKACLRKLRHYTESPQVRRVNYGARHREGERVGTGLVESGADFIVNVRMARSQHM